MYRSQGMAKGNEYEQPIEKLFNLEEFKSMGSEVDSPNRQISGQTPENYKDKFCQRSRLSTETPNSNNMLKNMFGKQTKENKNVLNSMIYKKDQEKKGILTKILEKVGLGPKDKNPEASSVQGQDTKGTVGDVNNKYVIGAIGKGLANGQAQKDAEGQKGFLKSIGSMFSGTQSSKPAQQRPEIAVEARNPGPRSAPQQVTPQSGVEPPATQSEIDKKTISSLAGLVVLLVAVLAFQIAFPE